MIEQLKTTTGDPEALTSPEKWLESVEEARTDWQQETIAESWREVHYPRHHQLTGNEQLDITYACDDPRADQTWKLFNITPKDHPKEALFGNRFQPKLDENFREYLLQKLVAFSVIPTFPREDKINLHISFPKSPLEAVIPDQDRKSPFAPIGFDKTFEDTQIELDFLGNNKDHLFIHGGKRAENIAASIATSLALQASPDELEIITLSRLPQDITERLSQLPHFLPDLSSKYSTLLLNGNLSRLTSTMEKRRQSRTPSPRHILAIINNIDWQLDKGRFLQYLSRLGKGGKQQNIMVIATSEDYNPRTIDTVESALSGEPEGLITSISLSDETLTSAILTDTKYPSGLVITPMHIDQTSLNHAAEFANNKWRKLNPRRKPEHPG